MALRRTTPEGTLFAVPLSPGWAVGLLVRTQPPGGFGYFFGPRRTTQPSPPELTAIAPTDAVLACRFTVGALHRGEWPLIGLHPDWHPDDWPIPPFIRYDELLRQHVVVVYTNDLFEPAAEFDLQPGDTPERHPPDAFFGEGLMPEYLSKLIG